MACVNYMISQLTASMSSDHVNLNPVLALSVLSKSPTIHNALCAVLGGYFVCCIRGLFLQN
jgi:hypothetical protein